MYFSLIVIIVCILFWFLVHSIVNVVLLSGSLYCQSRFTPHNNVIVRYSNEGKVQRTPMVPTYAKTLFSKCLSALLFLVVPSCSITNCVVVIRLATSYLLTVCQIVPWENIPHSTSDIEYVNVHCCTRTLIMHHDVLYVRWHAMASMAYLSFSAITAVGSYIFHCRSSDG